MADNKSCEGKTTTLECLNCGYREVFTERQYKNTDGLSCYVCNGPAIPSITKPGEQIRNRRMAKKKENVGGVDFATGKDLTVTVNIDVSDALKGLKAVQREAKKTAHILKEIEGRTEAEWKAGIENLARRVKDDSLITELCILGSKSLPEIVALNSLTDEKLTEYLLLRKEKSELTFKQVEGMLLKILTDDEILVELSSRGWEIDETKLSTNEGTIPEVSYIEMRKNYNKLQEEYKYANTRKSAEN